MRTKVEESNSLRCVRSWVAHQEEFWFWYMDAFSFSRSRHRWQLQLPTEK